MVWLTLILAVSGILFLILMLTFNGKSPIDLIFGMLAIITNLTVAGKVPVIEIPYEVAVENAADNSIIVREGIHEVTTAAPGLYWLFLGFALVAFVWVFVIVFKNLARESPI